MNAKGIFSGDVIHTYNIKMPIKGRCKSYQENDLLFAKVTCCLGIRESSHHDQTKEYPTDWRSLPSFIITELTAAFTTTVMMINLTGYPWNWQL
jgi:flagellar biosynthesis protein FliP